MAEDAKQLNDLEKLTQDIINRFETALNVTATSELSSVVDSINKSLEKQVNLIQNISINSTDRLSQTKEEVGHVKDSTTEIQKQTQLYQNILAHNEDITDNWNQIIKKSASAGKNYRDINKEQKDYLLSLNVAIKKEKELSKLTVSRMKAATKIKTAPATSNRKGKGGVPQFVNIQGVSSTQIGIESLTGGKPYFASHPEMGVPIGLFNTKDEPNSAARIKAIQKYGANGSINGVFPQYAQSDLPTMSPSSANDANLSQAGVTAAGVVVAKIIKQQLNPILDVFVEIIDIATKLGDKFEQYGSEADEAIRSAIQGSGSVMAANWGDMFGGGTPITRASIFQQSMQSAAFELNVTEGVFASYEMLSELQKSFSQSNKTNVLLGKDDLKNMIYIQGTFDLAASDVAEMQSTFMEIGLSSQDMVKYTDDLAKDARKFGLNATQLLKDTAKLMKLGAGYRFKGGVKDMEKMQIYAANAKFDIEKAYSTMETSMTVEGAIDLASQLQLLGGSFADISGLELFSKAVSGDMEGFTQMIEGRFAKDVGRFGGIDKNGQFQMSPQGNALLMAFKNIDNLKMGDDVANIITKAAKNKAVRDKLMSGDNRTAFMGFSADDQKTIVENIAQGSIKSLNLTGDSLTDGIIDFNNMVLDQSAANKTVGAETSKGAQSAADEAKLNEQLVKIESQQVEALQGLKDGLMGLKNNLLYAGEAIYSVGLDYFKSPFFKKMEVLTDYLGLDLKEAILFHDYFKKGNDGLNNYASTMKALMTMVSSPGSLLAGAASSVVNASSKPAEEQRATANKIEEKAGHKTVVSNVVEITSGGGPGAFNKYGGMLEAAGGMVMGPSHESGGVRGTGRFNNVEVEGGEAIINKKSTQMFLPLLSKLNELGGGVSFGGSSSNLTSNNYSDKTVNIRINGNIKYNSNMGESTAINVIDLAQEIASLTDGKSFGGAY